MWYNFKGDNMLKVIEKNGDVYLENLSPFVLKDTLDCGQAFRWQEINENEFCGIAMNKFLHIIQTDDCVIFKNTTKEQFYDTWYNYFDCERDYNEILSALSVNDTLKKVCDFSSGIRLLNQEPFEAICSFIISQNNNIPRIKGIISRLCENFGDKIDGGYTFPSAEKIASLCEDDLSVIRAGFRAKYIIDGAKKTASGEIDFDFLRNAPIDKAREHIMQIKGVGPKVADCALLFGFSRMECFPVDVWIRKAVNSLFGGEVPECALPYAGIAQQYIFHYARKNNIKL